MNSVANQISQRLSLRQPLRESLDILATIADSLELRKEVDLLAELEKVKSLYPTCTDFEREFPSICYSIATGVGKTRLMGACIAYLFLKKGIRNFFVLAPNLTIYNKLIEDFGNPGNPKYVFNGIAEFVHNRPVIVHGDNYQQAGALFGEQEVRINIFNISKFNSDNKAKTSGGQKLPPRMKRLSEYLGQSYWAYLSGLTDLVVLMDEAHRYHADASRNAINELKPVLGIELTATPIDEKGNPFRNVVYKYSLAQALSDGKYVKHPTIATRRNFDAKGLSQKEVELVKLEDAVSLHRDTQIALELYSRDNRQKLVKPFILVICTDINHARETYEYINSDLFYQGEFVGKVLQIDSSTRNEDAIEEQFLTLEHPDNQIEIVIHVNMLKEGWDVTNLYTIVPLRAANAPVLIEQTIGRGLRLPFGGERTGEKKLDQLTVIAHDNFQKVIEAAQAPNSILRKMSLVELDEMPTGQKAEVVVAPTILESSLHEEEKQIQAIHNEVERAKMKSGLDAKRYIVAAWNHPEIIRLTKGSEDLAKPGVKEAAIKKVEQLLDYGQQDLFKAQMRESISEVYDQLVVSYRQFHIDIPRLIIEPVEQRAWFEDFDLDTRTGFELTKLNEEIQRVNLMDHTDVEFIGVQQGAYVRDTPVQQLIAEVVNYPEIDYFENSVLIHKLATQAVQCIEVNLTDRGELPAVIRQFRRVIGGRIYEQMMQHFKVAATQEVPPQVLPFSKIEQWNLSRQDGDGYKDFREKVQPRSAVPRYIYTGFKRACHPEYKFDSGTEKDFAWVLEHDKTVLCWMRPAPSQFQIYWSNNSRLYHPDFIIETHDAIYMVETKAENELKDPEVLDKKSAGEKYCRYASEYNQSQGKKPWRYVLVGSDRVDTTKSFLGVVS